MVRRHLFRIKDQFWCPTLLRDYSLDVNKFIIKKFKVFEPLVPEIAQFLKDSDVHQVIDLASGPGSGWRKITAKLKKEFPDLKVTFTDYYPDRKSLIELCEKDPETFNFLPQAVDAQNVPKGLIGLRSMFLSFYNFNPKEAANVLQNAVDHEQPICIIELNQRSLRNIVSVLLKPLVVLLFTPFMKPFDWKRLFFTYLFPLVPLIVFWDEAVSMLRAYSIRELKSMIVHLNNHESFVWHVCKIKGSSFRGLLFLSGRKK